MATTVGWLPSGDRIRVGGLHKLADSFVEGTKGVLHGGDVICFRAMTRAKLGQHWLVDKRATGRIADAIELREEEACIEIGGGRGALTRVIASRCKRLIVFEIDSGWAEHLRKFAPSWGGNVEVREADALKIEWDRTALGLEPVEPLVITGNLPYYITSPLLLRLAYSGLDFRRAILLIQKEVAERIASRPSDHSYGRLSVSLGAFLETEILFNIPPAAFKPPPKVTSTLIRMTPRKTPLVEPDLVDTFERTVQVAFHMRRKTLKNNLHAGFPELPVAKIEDIIQRMGVSPSARAQEVTVEGFVTLSRMLRAEKNA